MWIVVYADEVFQRDPGGVFPKCWNIPKFLGNVRNGKNKEFGTACSKVLESLEGFAQRLFPLKVLENFQSSGNCVRFVYRRDPNLI